jgi:flagellar motor switch protein FliN
MNERELGRVLLEELTQAVGALSGATASQGQGTASDAAPWTITISAEGALRAACVVTVDHDSAEALATVVAGQADDGSVERVLRDALSQTITGVLARESATGIQLVVRSVTKTDTAPSGSALLTGAINATGLTVPMQVGYYAVLAPTVTGTRGRQSARHAAAAEPSQGRLDVILDIDLPVVVRFGRTEMPLRAVTRIAPGSVIDLGRSPDDPVELLVSDRVVARGEVVVVGGNYGIRIVDVVSPSERMRSMEA